MSAIVSLEQYYTKIDGLDLILPNSVSVDGEKIIITDSGNNRICVVIEDVEYSIGGQFGIGKYKFKEPVYSTSHGTRAFVCDWQNHRIMVYVDCVFKNQIGIFGLINEPKIINFLRFLKTFKNNGSFDYSHFNGEGKRKSVSLSISVKNLSTAILYYLKNPIILISNLMKENFISKPNGLVLVNNYLFFTQKDNRCVSCYDLTKNRIVKQADNTNELLDFGRLGQISLFNECLYVCDETNNKIWILDLDLNLIKFVTITEYNIFSISFNDHYIATCGVNTFTLFDHSFNKIFESNGDGEYHGVCMTVDKLYVVNRLKHRIEQYKINNVGDQV